MEKLLACTQFKLTFPDRTLKTQTPGSSLPTQGQYTIRL